MQLSMQVNPASPKDALYRQICEQLQELLGEEKDFVADAANTVALLFQSLPDVSWAGFYMAQGRDLVLGPFQGRPAVARIPLGKGVCGKAAVERQALIVSDTSRFPGHIACDPEAKSEIVVPVLNWGRLLGVLDIDSHKINRFDEDDKEGIESVVSVFLAAQASDELPDLNERVAPES
jgi:L-methionine (R)-S-oxide reductase